MRPLTLTLLLGCAGDTDPVGSDTSDTDVIDTDDTDVPVADVPPDPSPEAVTVPTLKIRLWEDDRYVVALLSPDADHGKGIAAIDNAAVSCADGSSYAFETPLEYLLLGGGSDQFQGGTVLGLYYADPDTTYENVASASTDLFWFGCQLAHNPEITNTFSTVLTLEDGTVYDYGAIEMIGL